MIERAKMIPTNSPNIKRHRYHDSPLNVKRLRPNVNSFGIELNSDDLLTEILLRLPVKSLTRFKSVCRRWLSIISSDYFCHQHTLRHPKLQPSLLLQVDYRDFFYLNPTTNGEEKMIPYRRSFPLCGCTIVVACNGLMLLQFQGCNDDYLSNEGHYYVYSLTTRKSRKIALNRKNDEYLCAGMGLAFDPSRSPYYKIVCIYTSNTKEDLSSYNDELMTSYQIEVYDSESHSWKLALEAAYVPKLHSIRGTHWNNKIYWQSRIGYCYFDIDKNEMKTQSFPETGRLVFPSLRESNGHLYLCENDALVWELVGNDHDGPTPTSVWLFKHHALVDGYDIIVGLMAGSDGDETCSLLTHNSRMISVYSFGDQTLEDLIDLTTLPCYQQKHGCFTTVTGFQFGETLALV